MTEQSVSGKRIALGAIVATCILLGGMPGVARAQSAAFEKPADIQKKVETAFADAPVMVAVAKCESGFRQFYDSGNVFRGGSGKYIGIFQIDENLHKNPASSVGFDIYTVDGNIGYAQHLYASQGANPWKNCSNKYYGTTAAPAAVAPAATATIPAPAEAKVIATPAFPITSDLKQGSKGVEVKELQKLLNKNGYAIAATGAGSLNNETENFGELTRKAVERFQCAQQIACTGESGYGQVGPATRTALQKFWN